MPKNKVSDPITDQEIAFARLVLSGAMTDRRAAEAVGLDPDSVAYIKSKPRVRAYMLEHRAAVEQQFIQQEADGLHRPNLDREQVLARLWEIAHLSPATTRNSVTGQVKSLSIIVAILELIPDRRAVSAPKKSAPAPVKAEIYKSAWLRKQQAANPDPTELSSRPERPAVSPAPAPNPTELSFRPEEPAVPTVPTQPALAPRVPLAENLPPYVPPVTFVPDTRVPFSIKKNLFNRLR